MIITIDGPTASGKSTVARLLAHELGYYYVASGLLFRALAYVLIMEKSYTPAMLMCPKESDLRQLLNQHDFVYTYTVDQHEQVYYKDKRLTPYLKTKEIDHAASVLSTNPLVREYILNMQRAIAKQHDVVVDGRDAGSVVFPYAEVKFFLTADLDVRAQRWLRDQQKKGVAMSFEQAKKELELRDERDMNRAIAPLKVPENATIIDNSRLSIMQTVIMMKELIRK